MYRGFNLKLDCDSSSFYDTGLGLLNEDKIIIKKTLDKFILPNGSINGSELQENWFPKIMADIFISHSHKDEKLAICLAGWLYETFNIKSFIDSCIWGCSYDLLKVIDDKYCLNGNSTYDYIKSSYSASHVHMMLLTALNKMIDNTECLFFLNTPNSISVSGTIDKTNSPWIYAEIVMAETIRKQEPLRRKYVTYFSKSFEGDLSESMKFEYDLDSSHLTDINQDTLIEWQDNIQEKDAEKALDKLYYIVKDY